MKLTSRMLNNVISLKLYMGILLPAIACGQQTTTYQEGSHFKYGFARVIKYDTLPGGKVDKVSLYIDSTGKKAFDFVSKGDFAVGRKPPKANRQDSLLPENFLLVQKDGKFGAITQWGTFLLQPIYDYIYTDSPAGWRVEKNGRQSIYTAEGFLLPFKYEKVQEINQHYVAVLQKGKWGVYDIRQKKLVIPEAYQSLDFCKMCQNDVPFIFAKKNNLWGILDFQNQIKVPFEYHYDHLNSPNKTWITSFFKNGERMAVNSRTFQVHDHFFDDPEKANDTAILAGGFRLIRKNHKYGLVNSKGDVVLDFKYNYIIYDLATSETPLSKYVSFNKDNLWGLADTLGHMIISPKFETIIHYPEMGLAIEEKPDGEGMLLSELKGGKVILNDYDDIELEHTIAGDTGDEIRFFKVKKNNQYGIYIPQSQSFTPPKYERIDLYTDVPFCIAVLENNKMGLLNIKTNSYVVPPEFSYYFQLENGQSHLWKVKRDGKYGLFDSKAQKLLCPIIYNGFSPVKGSPLIIYVKGDGTGLIDAEGREITPAAYSEIEKLRKGFFALMKQDEQLNYSFDFYDTKSQKVLHPTLGTVTAVMNDSVAALSTKDGYHLYSPSTGEIIHGNYEEGGLPDLIYFTDNDLAIIQKNKRVGLASAKGEMITDLKYTSIGDFHEGTAKVTVDNYGSFGNAFYGFINAQGEEIIPPEYTDDQSLNLDYFIKDYLLLTRLKEVKESINESRYVRVYGLAAKDGKTLIPAAYQQLKLQNNGAFVIVEKHGKFGVLTLKGETVIPADFTNLVLDQHPYPTDVEWQFSFPLLAEKNGKFQYYDKNGKPIGVRVNEPIPFEDTGFSPF